jgi:tetratricopeptide (TPR) repeat protein
LSCVCLIDGDSRLIARYVKARGKVQESKEGSEQENRQILARKLLAGHLREFAPNLSKDKEQGKAFGIKKELYRPFQEILSSLSLLYKLTATNTFERIDELVTLRVFSPQGAANLKRAVSQALSLRLEAHLFYKDETEYLHCIEPGQPPDPHKLYLDSDRITRLEEIYKVLIPFHQAAREFYTTREKKTLEVPFYDEGRLTRAAGLEQSRQYNQARTLYQEAATLNNRNIEALLGLGRMELKLGDPEEAKRRAEMALNKAKLLGEEHVYVITSYNDIGEAFYALKRYRDALDNYNEALKIRLKVLRNGDPDIAWSYRNIGEVWHVLANDWYNQGKDLHAQGKYTEALTHYKEALAYHTNALNNRQQGLGRDHPDIALSYQNLGEVLHAQGKVLYTQGKYTEALACHTNALNNRQQGLGGDHPDIAANYHDIGEVCLSLDKRHEALTHFKKARDMRRKVLGNDHPDTSSSCNKINNIMSSQWGAITVVALAAIALWIVSIECLKQEGVGVKIVGGCGVLTGTGCFGLLIASIFQVFSYQRVLNGR